ncbi:MAG: type IX secretion system membrane protein PorP/SprF [Cellulophaga sp.]|uniref:PorP/SprF family type IX secretion system membrane protein n=1 Tax=unclassified Cellulophaga TaxID=2634405 RepID=UPI000C2C5331|nr:MULTISPECIES: type IX secretion system membrane protein PorP/SprF [unclassified Cellulophaga]MDO6493093.1 type IX secretion system membrane protein PorP/SprF [Cellulophaga sp. 2_MG-2023]MDO6496483.1 type IX secretion system membrane protein PorP/SprF [Cellulophaga sp. 3_MG-2023]PKB43455.1 type IX secretion system PorP/SprF family membrane protein [Cellulophaga sp. RHA19]
MIKRSILATIILVILVLDSVSAQQDAQYTQYMFNTLAVNPAYAGSRGQLSIAALYRSQWVGLDGAPKTQTLNLHSPIRNSNLGYGVSIVNDEIGDGVVQETYVDGTLSYTLKLAQERKLSFGLKVGFNRLNLDFDKLRKIDDEVVETNNIDNRFSPNFGLGFYYHTNKFYFGLSAPNLLETDHFDSSNSDSDDGVQFLSQDKINLYAITGYVFDLNNDLKFKPALLTKVVSGAPLQVDLSANFLYNEKFSFGAAYRWDAAVSAMAGFQVSDQIMLGLAYDKETTELGGTQFNDGSFEVFLRFELVRAFEKLVSPRFF